MKRNRIIFFLTGFLLCGLFGSVFTDAAVSQSAVTRVFISPDEVNLKPCEETTIAIRVEDVENLTAFDVRVTFDPEVVKIISVENGGFLVSPDEPALFSPDNNDGDWNTDGFIRFGLAQQRDSVTGKLNPKSGSGDLVLITKKAACKPSACSLEIDRTVTKLVWWGHDPDDPTSPVDGSLIPYEPKNGKVNVKAVLYFPIFTR